MSRWRLSTLRATPTAGLRAGCPMNQLSPMSISASSIVILQPFNRRPKQGTTSYRASCVQAFTVMRTIIRGTSSFARNIYMVPPPTLCLPLEEWLGLLEREKNRRGASLSSHPYRSRKTGPKRILYCTQSDSLHCRRAIAPSILCQGQHRVVGFVVPPDCFPYITCRAAHLRPIAVTTSGSGF